MNTDTKKRIYEFIKDKNPTTIKQLVNFFGFSEQLMHRHVKSLVQEGLIYKTGISPKVYYFPKIETNYNYKFSINEQLFLNENFLNFSPDGKTLEGDVGFINWCNTRNINPIDEIKVYQKTIEKYNNYKKTLGLIDGLDKFRTSFDKVYLDEIYYIDFYSIEKYGKTKLGNLVYYGKQSQNESLINKIVEIILNPIYNILKSKDIDGFGFIPPSIKRKVQIIDKINKKLNLKQFGLKEVTFQKIFKGQIVSQKSLSKKEDRIINAKETIFIKDNPGNINNLIIIDDAVGSGATFNEVAKKIKNQGIANKVIGLAIVGSFKGFEVINEI